ncbi:MAG: signal peptidase I [Dehalococcoidia bacterium]|nr:signal peptidase I [Dehalococcoidia bacterium]
MQTNESDLYYTDPDDSNSVQSKETFDSGIANVDVHDTSIPQKTTEEVLVANTTEADATSTSAPQTTLEEISDSNRSDTEYNTPLLLMPATEECDTTGSPDVQPGQDPQVSAKKKSWLKNIFRELLIYAAILLVLFLGINLVLQNSIIVSVSMNPTLSENDRILIYKLAYKFGHEPQRGDIIVFTPPEHVHSDSDYIKRIIGLPGEIVEIKNGYVHIHKPDGSTITLEEPYIAEHPNYTYTSQPIPADSYFVMGDNRNHSSDSHTGWTVTRDSIVGRAFWTVWPFSKFGAASNYNLPK